MASVCYSHRLADAALACALLLCCFIVQGEAQEEGSVRLTGGNHALQGYLEVYSAADDQWGTVCKDEWDSKDADVVCRQIGAVGGAMFPESPHTFTGVDGTVPVRMSELQCDGTERRLTDCAFKNVTTCTHAQDVKMDCVIPGYTACIKFNDSANPPLMGRRHNAGGMSINECTKLCRADGYHYAGVGQQDCLCGSAGEDFQSTVVANEHCNSECQGEASQDCGTEGHLAVHEVMIGSCSGNIKARKGAITSPEFPGTYPLDGRACQWVVDVSENGDTTLQFPVFQVAEEDILQISTDGGEDWETYLGAQYKDNPPPSMTFDDKKIIVRFIMTGALDRTDHVAFALTFQDDTTCEVVKFANGSLDVMEGTLYRPGDKVEVLCNNMYRSDWKYATCREDGLWYKAPECKEAPPRGHSLAFTQTYLFMMLAVMGALGVIFFMVICGVICVGRKKKKEGYTGISRQESVEPTKAENEYHIDMREGSEMDMQHVGGDAEQAIPLATGAMDE